VINFGRCVQQCISFYDVVLAFTYWRLQIKVRFRAITRPLISPSRSCPDVYPCGDQKSSYSSFHRLPIIAFSILVPRWCCRRAWPSPLKPCSSFFSARLRPPFPPPPSPCPTSSAPNTPASRIHIPYRKNFEREEFRLPGQT
jgi:hypothetical protein